MPFNALPRPPSLPAISSPCTAAPLGAPPPSLPLALAGVGHFAIIAARLEPELRELAGQHHHGGRDRAALWLWQAHNSVNERLASEALTDSPATAYAEYAKVQWPARSVCPKCRQVALPPPQRRGALVEVRWQHDHILRWLLEQYCLEPHFECWDELQRMGAPRRSVTESHATLGALAAACLVCLLLLAACGCFGCHGRDTCAHGKPAKKDDHVV